MRIRVKREYFPAILHNILSIVVIANLCYA